MIKAIALFGRKGRKRAPVPASAPASAPAPDPLAPHPFPPPEPNTPNAVHQLTSSIRPAPGQTLPAPQINVPHLTAPSLNSLNTTLDDTFLSNPSPVKSTPSASPVRARASPPSSPAFTAAIARQSSPAPHTVAMVMSPPRYTPAPSLLLPASQSTFHHTSNAPELHPTGDLTSPAINYASGTLMADLWNALQRRLLTDVVLVVTDPDTGQVTEYPAHKVILVARSEEFRSLLATPWDPSRVDGGSDSLEPTSTSTYLLRIPLRHPHRAMAQVVRFMYQDTCDFSSESVWQMRAIASELRFPSLVHACDTFVEQTITASTACQYLVHAMA